MGPDQIVPQTDSVSEPEQNGYDARAVIVIARNPVRFGKSCQGCLTGSRSAGNLDVGSGRKEIRPR